MKVFSQRLRGALRRFVCIATLICVLMVGLSGWSLETALSCVTQVTSSQQQSQRSSAFLLLGAGCLKSLRVQGCHCDIIILPCQRSSHWIALWRWCFNMFLRLRPTAVDQYQSLHQSGFRVQRRFRENLQNLLWREQRQTGRIVLVGLKPDFSKSP